MAAHKKYPTFIRVISKDKVIVCINPAQLGSFQILEKAKITVKDPDAPDGKRTIEGDTVRFYYPSGTGLSYTVGIDLSQEEFDYICSCLVEFLYLNEPEFKAKSEAIERERTAKWNAEVKTINEETPESPVDPKA